MLLPAEWRLTTTLLVGWDAGVALYLGIVYWIDRALGGRAISARMRRKRMKAAIAMLVLTVTATLASLAAIVALLGQGAGQKQTHRQLAVRDRNDLPVMGLRAFDLRAALRA